MDALESKRAVLAFVSLLENRARLQRALDWTLYALIPAAAAALILDLAGAPLPATTALPLLFPAAAFAAGRLAPCDRRGVLLAVDRRLRLREALLTAAAIAADSDAPTELEELQMERTLHRIDGTGMDLALPWQPPLLLPAAPLLLLATLLLTLLPSSGVPRGATAQNQVREMSRRLAARSEETGDERFSELAELLERYLPATPATPGDDAERQADSPGGEDLRRTPSPSGESGGDFAFDTDLEAIFRLEPRRAGEGYALGESLAELLDLDQGERARLEEQLRELDSRPAANSGGEEGAGGPGSGDEGGRGATDSRGGSTAGGGESAGGDEESPAGSDPGGGTGDSPGERSDEEYAPEGGDLGSLESLSGEVTGEEQLRGAMRYLSPEGRSLIEGNPADPAYRRMRQSPRRDREEHAGYDEYIGDYFRLLNERAAGEEDTE